MVKIVKIYVLGDDGKTYSVDQSWIKQFLGICALERKVHDLEKPVRMQHILDVLMAEGKPRSSNWLQRWISDLEWRDVWDLEKKGMIRQFKSGAHTMWELRT